MTNPEPYPADLFGVPRQNGEAPENEWTDLADAKPPTPEASRRAYTLAELRTMDLAADEDVSVIGDGILTKGGKLRIHGRQGAGKTTCLIFTCGALSAGTRILGRWTVERPRKVLLLQAELTLAEIADHAARLGEAGFADTPADHNLIIIRDTQLRLPADADILRRLVLEHRPDVLALDTINRYSNLVDSWRDAGWAAVHRIIDGLLEDTSLGLEAYIDTAQSNVTGQRVATSFEVEAWPSTMIRLERVDGVPSERKVTFEKVRAPWSSLNGSSHRLHLDDEGGYLPVELRGDPGAGVLLVVQALRRAAGQMDRQPLIAAVCNLANRKPRSASQYLTDAMAQGLVVKGEKHGREQSYSLVEEAS